MKHLKLITATLVGGFMLGAAPVAMATSVDAAPSAPAAVLSSAELEAFRIGATGSLPPNCEVVEFEGACLVIMCNEPGGGPMIYPCDAFGH